MLQTPVQANLELTLKLLQAALMKYVGLPPERCYFVALDDPHPAHPQAEQYVTLALGSMRVKQSVIRGAGRSDARCVQDVRITGWCRVALDEAGKADVFLLDSKRGIIAFRRAIINAILTLVPVDATQNVLALPVRVRGSIGAGQSPDDPEWGKVELTAEVEWEEDIDLSRVG